MAVIYADQVNPTSYSLSSICVFFHDYQYMAIIDGGTITYYYLYQTGNSTYEVRMEVTGGNLMIGGSPNLIVGTSQATYPISIRNMLIVENGIVIGTGDLRDVTNSIRIDKYDLSTPITVKNIAGQSAISLKYISRANSYNLNP